MSQTKSSNKLSNRPKTETAWNEAIEEAKERIKDLKRAIKTYERSRDEGAIWPGFEVSGRELCDEKAGTAKESVPA
ncbi:MAG: hypothetical protein LAP21_01385 [Acidobacteriia bacterium]|nr:hypothetical protein [Terriglobia bacterium]